MARFTGFSIGPFVFGSTSEDAPRRSDGEALIVWLLTGALFLPGAPIIGILIIVGALIVYTAARTAAHTDTEDQP